MPLNLSRLPIAIGLAATLFLSTVGESTSAEPLRVYFGTYTRGSSEGIYHARLDPETGRLDSLQLATEITNPSFLALHPSKPLVYAVGEVANLDGEKGGGVAAFRMDRESGRLELLNQRNSGGAGPCHVSVLPSGDLVAVANYSGGSVACFPIESDGSLGPMGGLVQHEGSSVESRRQSGPHAHSIVPDAAGRFLFAPDLGIDKIMIYRIDAGRLVANDPAFAPLAPGSGPRHFTFHPGGRFAYVINELASTVTAFRYDADRGSLEEIQTVTTLPADFEGNNTTAEIQVHPSGKFLYGSNRGHDSIAVFQINQDTGRLTPVGHTSSGGKTPRNFGIEPGGRFLLAANQGTNNVVVLKINQDTGSLEPTGHELEVGSPVCVKFVRN